MRNAVHKRGALYVSVSENADGTATICCRNVKRGNWFGWESHPDYEAACSRYHLSDENRLSEAEAAAVVA